MDFEITRVDCMLSPNNLSRPYADKCTVENAIRNSTLLWEGILMICFATFVHLSHLGMYNLVFYTELQQSEFFDT